MKQAKRSTGCQYLRQYLDKNTFSLAQLDQQSFCCWLRQQIERRSNDPVFVQRCAIRDLQKKHFRQFASLQRKSRQATADFAACTNQKAIEQLEYAIKGCKKAIAGLDQAVDKATGEKQRACQEKLEQFRQKLTTLQRQWQELWQQTPEKRESMQAEEALANFCATIGLTDEEQKLSILLRQAGHRHSQSGNEFEQQVFSSVKEWVVPVAQNHFGIKDDQVPEILSRVTLGCAAAELDYLVVMPNRQSRLPVQVIAVVEVKRNTNDVVGGFLQRQENLAWFTQTHSGYQAERYRTNVFRQGHFDRPAEHQENGRKFVFSCESFTQFHQDRHYGYFLDNLFFITTTRRLLGMTSAEHSRLLYKISTDVHFDLDDNYYLNCLWKWTKDAVAAYQTKDVLTIYATQQHWADQFIFIE